MVALKASQPLATMEGAGDNWKQLLNSVWLNIFSFTFFFDRGEGAQCIIVTVDRIVSGVKKRVLIIARTKNAR